MNQELLELFRYKSGLQVILQANKVMHLAAIAYNIKKYLNYTQKRVKSGAARLALIELIKRSLQYFLGTSEKHKKYAFQY